MVKAVEPDLLKCLPYWAYKQISSGPLLSILSQYRERSGERAESGVVKPPLVSGQNRTSGRDSVGLVHFPTHPEKLSDVVYEN